MRGLRFRHLWLPVTLVAVMTGGSVVAWYRASALPKRFGVVVEHQLYRSGSVSLPQLERLQRDFGVRRVICLLNASSEEARQERDAAQRLGLEWQNVALPGNGASTAEDRRRILELLRDSQAGPTLVHCAAGTNRTGLAIGLYRLHEQGWPLERVMRELRAFDFRDDAEHEDLRASLAAEAAAAKSRAVATRPSATP